MDGNLFRECAKRLKELDEADEADYRSSVSRYYYSCFHRCKSLENVVFSSLTETESTHLKLFTTHRKLIHSLENRAKNLDDQRVLKLVGNKMGLILQSRLVADYELSLVVDKAQANQASTHCSDIVKLLNQLIRQQ